MIYLAAVALLTNTNLVLRLLEGTGPRHGSTGQYEYKLHLGVLGMAMEVFKVGVVYSHLIPSCLLWHRLPCLMQGSSVTPV
jgi:hypothetical protein